MKLAQSVVKISVAAGMAAHFPRMTAKSRSRLPAPFFHDESCRNSQQQPLSIFDTESPDRIYMQSCVHVEATCFFFLVLHDRFPR